MSRVIIYLRSNYKNKKGKSSIQLHIHLQNKKIVLPTGLLIEETKWDQEKKRVRGNSQEVKDMNLIISNCRSRATDIFVRYKLQNKELTPELFKREYSKPSIFIDFYEFYEREMNLKKGMAHKNTIETHTSALNKLKDFRPTLMFSEMDETFFQEFYKYMRVTLKNKDSTSAKTLDTIKAYLNIAVRKKLIPENPYPQNMQVHRSAIERVYLSPTELKKLILFYRKNLFPANLQNTLRYFLFSCCTGLRISDIKAVKWKNITGDMLLYTPVKTSGHGKIVRVPLVDFARELIKPEPENKNLPLFVTFKDQVTNRYLKDIADKVGIKKQITSHTGRHTFATIYLRHSHNLVGLKELMGHTNIDQTMVYAHIIYDDLKKDMGIFDELSNASERGNDLTDLPAVG